ncbi:hypothetical protein DRQ25_10800 [Candidatus Fermentibacteria bacterium]|nr:MAG: hypothetical protein DRQ25_10800 [Candidatus Fermentibacteria bacterium]
MSTANLDSADLKAVPLNGLIKEDVMNKIWDISKIPLPFTDMIGSGSAKNAYKEWTTDELAAPDVANAVVDGADATGNDTQTGERVGNHHQTSDKVVRVSYRANASDTIGRAKELAYQLTRRQQELRRDVEAISMLNQASIADNGDAVAGKVGGLPTWMRTNTVNLTTPVGFNNTTGVTTVPTATTDGITLTESAIRDVVESIYNEGGDPTVLMTVPGIIRKISEYLFTSSARVATLMSDQGKSSEKATALGSVNVFVTDFGTLRLVPNRLQQLYDAVYANPSLTADFADVFILDPAYLRLCYLYGYRTDILAKTGLAENRQMAVDWSLIVNTEKAHGIIASVDPTAAMTA